MPENTLPYPINDADNHFNEPDDCFERYIDPSKIDLAIRSVRSPDGKRIQLFAGQPSKFHSDQVTFSKDELEKMLGDTSKVGTGRGTVPHEEGQPDLGVVPGMLLNRLNPLKGLSDEERQAFVSEFRNKSEAFGDRDLRLALDGRAGHRQGAHVPRGRARHRVRVRRQHRGALREHPRVQPLDVRRGRLRRRGSDVAPALHLVRRSRAGDQRAEDRDGSGRDRDPDQVGTRARRRRQPVRRTVARRSRLRRLLEHRQRRGDAARGAPRRHRLPEVRRRLVRGSRDRVRRLRRLPVDDVLGRPSGDGAHVRAHPAQLLRPFPQHARLPLGAGHGVAAVHAPQDGPRVHDGSEGEVGRERPALRPAVGDLPSAFHRGPVPGRERATRRVRGRHRSHRVRLRLPARGRPGASR